MTGARPAETAKDKGKYPNNTFPIPTTTTTSGRW